MVHITQVKNTIHAKSDDQTLRRFIHITLLNTKLNKKKMKNKHQIKLKSDSFAHGPHMAASRWRLRHPKNINIW